MLIVGTVVVLLVTCLAREWLAPSLAVVGAMVVLLLAGILSPAQALAGFSNPAPVTVAAMLVIARAVEKTGLLAPLLGTALGDARDERRILGRLLGSVTATSAFLNNTPIVAMLISPISAWAERTGRSPSRYLMPVSFAALLGGMATLIGTSTNVAVSGLMVQAGMPPMGMFELTWIGGPVAIVGTIYLVWAAPRLLPERQGIRRQFDEQRRDFTIELEVVPGGPAVGRSVADAGLRHLDGVFLAWIRRRGQLIAPVGPDDILDAEDDLGFVGRIDRVVDLQGVKGLRAAQLKGMPPVTDATHGYFEAVVAPVSPLVGATLRSAGFRERYQATVLAIHRSGERLGGKLGDTVLRTGDTLLLLAEQGFRGRWRDRGEFLLISEVAAPMRLSSGRAALVVGILALVVALAAFEVLPVLHGSLAAALALVVFRILTPHEARSAVDLDLLLMLGASFGVGAAIESSGLARVVADGVVGVANAGGTVAVIAAVVAATVILTELISNTAAAVLMFPIAMAAARQAAIDPRGCALAIAVAASASFLTPIGYQTNAMVMGPGGYKFSDYWRLGLPLTLLVYATLVGAVAWRWSVAA